MLSIVKTQSTVDLRETYIQYMFVCYMRAPARPTRAEVKRGAVVDLGEIGAVCEKNWTRATCYSVAQRIPK